MPKHRIDWPEEVRLTEVVRMLGEMHAKACEPKHLAQLNNRTIWAEHQAGAPWFSTIFDQRVMQHAR